jgi:DNA-binding LacI/PurR family transcriptional regulator
MTAVGRLAGVSRSAVSLALANHPSIPAPTRDRILAAAQQLSYRPNPLVSALMAVRGSKGKLTSISVLAFLSSEPARSRPFLVRTYAHAQRRAMELGFRLETFSLCDPRMRPARLAGVLRARGIHGVLVGPLDGADTTLAFDLADFAVVGLGLSIRTPVIFRVAADHFREVQLAVRHAQALGYRRIGFATPQPVSERLEDRWLAGFLLAQSQMPDEARVPPWVTASKEELQAKLNGWIAQHDIDVVIHPIEPCYFEGAPVHVGLVRLAVAPDDSTYSGIAQNEARIGAAAVEQLVARLHHWSPGAEDASSLLLVQGSWVDGASAPGVGRRRGTKPAGS